MNGIKPAATIILATLLLNFGEAMLVTFIAGAWLQIEYTNELKNRK